uniref:hypothetical protein n=1 Tax=uncultured Draconibacterium sp. TaxID=1573823 RepID=UPI003216B1C1
MKRVKMFLACLSKEIKKKFFKLESSDISHDCEKLKDVGYEINSSEDLKFIEEYILKYTTTTRWQTL